VPPATFTQTNSTLPFLITVKPLFIVFIGGLKKKRWIRENNRCGSCSLNRIRSGTIEIERWIRENELSGNDRYRFHCSSNLTPSSNMA
jgi:hypothetical protein